MKNLFAVVRSYRSSFRVVLALSGALAGLLCLSGCVAGDRPVDNTAMLPENERTSTVPWSPPEKWEQQGQLGQMANDPRFANH